MPDLWELVDLHIDEIAVLFEATGAEWAEPPRPAPPRHGIGARSHAASKPAGKKAAAKRAGAPPVGEEGAAVHPQADRPQAGQEVRRQEDGAPQAHLAALSSDAPEGRELRRRLTPRPGKRNAAMLGMNVYAEPRGLDEAAEPA